MNVYLTNLNGLLPQDSSQYIQRMTAEIAHPLGFREMGIFRYNGAEESEESLSGRIDGIIAGAEWNNDAVICQFPTGNGLKLYGVSADQGLNVSNMGELSSGEFISALSKGGFGLVWYQDSESRRYMEYDASFSLSR